jgi:methyl-accepting chemotaxis protein
MALSLKTTMAAMSIVMFSCFVALGVVSVERMGAVSHQSIVMKSVWTPRVRLIAQLGDAARDYRISEGLRILSVSGDMAAHADGDLKDNAELFESELAAYRKLLQPKESPADVEKIDALWRDYRVANQRMLELAAQGQNADAADRFRNSTSRFYLLSDALSELSNADVARDAQASAKAIRIASDARLMIIGTTAVIIALMIASGIMFELKVSRVLIALAGVMQRLARGELDAEVIAADRDDEVGVMARAVQVFKDNGLEVRRLESEGQAQALAAEETRSKNEEILAAVEAQRALVVSSLATALAELSAGNLTYRLTTVFAPEFIKLSEDFNAAMDKLQDAMKQIQVGASGIRANADEISQSAEDLSRRTEQQAASLEETAAALDQITVTVRKTAEGAAKSSDVVLGAKTDAEHSGLIVRDAVKAMSEIERSAHEISQIIGVIDEIAFQTNLLALNAGVEAARAGEAGRGFAVVATEVRALAQRSAGAAKEIKALISKSTTHVDSGVRLVGQTGEALERLLASMVGINELVAEIAASAKDQANGLNEVNSSIEQMDRVTQQNAAMVQESTAASLSLATESQQLNGMIGRFDIGSAPAASRAPASRPRPALTRLGSGGGYVTAQMARSGQG